MAAAAEKSGRTASDIKIVAVTKTVDPEIVNTVLDEGINIIGENRVQEFISKYNDYRLRYKRVHFIGNLQTNKVKYIIDKVDMIESLSSIKLADEIDKCSKKAGRITDCLIEINIGNEENKSGLDKNLLDELLIHCSGLSNLRIRGLMAIPPKTEDLIKKSEYFKDMYKLFIDNNAKKLDNIFMDYLSMGMSSDYEEAILNGANIIRVGRALFGKG